MKILPDFKKNAPNGYAWKFIENSFPQKGDYFFINGKWRESFVNFTMDSFPVMRLAKAEEMSIEEKVIEWAKDRDLLGCSSDDVKSQTMKLVSEVGELCDALSHYDGKVNGDTIDALGDIEVVLIILRYKLNLTRIHCLSTAYDEIKDRTGKTINGVFIKDE